MDKVNKPHDALMQCLSCHQQFYTARGPTVCLFCGALYVKWLNVGVIRPDLAQLYGG